MPAGITSSIWFQKDEQYDLSKNVFGKITGVKSWKVSISVACGWLNICKNLCFLCSSHVAMALFAHLFTIFLAALLVLGSTLDRIGIPSTAAVSMPAASTPPRRHNNAQDNNLDDVGNEMNGDEEEDDSLDSAAEAVPITFIGGSPDELLASLPFADADLTGRPQRQLAKVDRNSNDENSQLLMDRSTEHLYSLIRRSK